MIKQVLRGAGERIEAWHQYRLARRVLLSMDRRSLADIGVTRAEIPFILGGVLRRSRRDRAGQGRAEAAAAEGPRRWLVLWTLVAAQFMFVVDAFIVNVAVPTIRADLHASAAQMNAVIAAYLIAYASLVIVGGRLGDIHGPRRVFLLGLAGFTLASVWCGVAHSPPELILARLVQGSTAALMVPQVLATIHVLFPGEERARAFAIYGLALGFGGAAGFLLGGLLVTLDFAGLGWRMVFFVNAPAGLAAAAAAWRLMPDGARRAGARIDLVGAALLFVGLVCLIGPLVFGRDFHWAPELWLAMAGGALLLVVFLKLERRIERSGRLPLIDCSLLLDRRFGRGLAGAFFFFVGNLSFYLVMTLFLQGTLNCSAWDAGLTMLPLAGAFVIASRHGGSARVLGRGCVCQIAGLGWLALLILTVERPGGWLLAPPLAVFGYGQGLVMAPLSNTVLLTVRRASAGAGSGLYGVTIQIANAAGVAAIGTLFFLIEEKTSDHAAVLGSLAAVGCVLSVSAVLLGRMHRAPSARLGLDRRVVAPPLQVMPDRSNREGRSAALIRQQ